MRSFSSSRAPDMDRLFWLSLLLTYLPVTESMVKEESCFLKPTVIWRKAGKPVDLKCDVNSDCSAKGLHYEWFIFKENLHFHLEVDSDPVKYSLDGASLNIKFLQPNDSGIYHCAVVSRGASAPGAQRVGLGTTLIVKEHPKTTVVRSILLWSSFVLLAIYSLAIVTLFIKKYGCKMSVSRRPGKTEKINATKKAQFRDVLHEMYNKRNMGRDKKRASLNHPQAQAATNEINSSTDDIYQNI